MKLSDLFEARFARQTYPDDELERLLQEPWPHERWQLVDALMSYIIDYDRDDRWRLKALQRYEDLMGYIPSKEYNKAALDKAVEEIRDTLNEIPDYR